MSETRLSPMHMTAFGAAAMRARHLAVDGYPKILVDDFAQPLLGMDTAQIVSSTRGMVDPHVATSWILRTRFVEDRLAIARTREVRQYVILGAGLDSYALRHDASHYDLIVYEVDDPVLQQWKRQRFQDLHVTVPPHLQFVACDFERTSLAEAFGTSTFDTAAPALVAWLGVTQYLTLAAVHATLQWAASLAADSEIVLSYVVPGDVTEIHRERLAARGVRFETFFTPEAILRLMNEAGLVGIWQMTPEEAQQQYFSGRADGLIAPDVERLIIGHTS